MKNISDFFFDKEKILDKSLTFTTTFLSKGWLNPVGNNSPSFFLGSSEDSNYSIFFSNLPDGWTTAARKLSKDAECRSIQVRMSNEDVACPVYSYEVIKNGKTIRIIQLLKENSWVFYNHGTPLDYERLDLYELKFKRKRLNECIILDYLNKEGIKFTSIYETEWKGVIFK